MLTSTTVTTELAAFPAEDRIDVWQDVCRTALLGDSVWPVGRPTDHFAASIRRRWIDDLLFIESTTSGYGAAYTPESQANDYIGFAISTASYGERLTLRDSTRTDVRGTSFLWANSRIRRYEQMGSGHTLLLYVPVDAVRACGGSPLCGAVTSDIASPAAKVLGAMLLALGQEQEELGPDETIPLRNSLVELVSSLSAQQEPPRPTAAVSAAMKRRIVSWIDARIRFGPVSPAEAAAVHGISIRSLQRLFEDGGGSFSAAVRSARLARARQDVVGSDDSLQVIALRWGFSDPSHFSREFRKAFDISPRDLRHTAPHTETALVSGLATV